MNPQPQPPDRTARLERSVQALQANLDFMKRRLYRLDALEALRQRGRSPQLPMQFRGQFGEDLVLWELFEDQADGFFIECGAYDGVTLSVSYAFEALGWKGLLVEPNPDRHADCARSRPGSRCVHAALSSRGSSGTAQFEIVEGAEDSQMFSFLNTEPGHLANIESAKWTRRKVPVPISTMDALLDGHSGPIDFAVIDVEGGELPLLDGFNLERWNPRVLFIEDATMGRDPAIRNYMTRFPYVEIGFVGVSRLYIHNAESALVERMRA